MWYVEEFDVIGIIRVEEYNVNSTFGCVAARWFPQSASGPVIYQYLVLHDLSAGNAKIFR